ncbi:MAG: hypothetical protein H7A46_09500 [Verrucomicrobiales bacterium]|nr:hypothetical protein [Verrucomicrobiales bacterium]
MKQLKETHGLSRRTFLSQTAVGLAAATWGGTTVMAQEAGVRPERTGGVKVLNPRGRVPVGIIIDDSTCLVNLNRFAMPQFNDAWGGKQTVYHRRWKEWPAEIPDSFVRRFAEWALDRGVKGKYSIVPYPACVGRMDRGLPGWSRRELEDSLALVRESIAPNWDIHPEMVSHTRVIDLKTGQPYPDQTPAYMENWDWTTGRSAGEIGDYLAYALQILKNAGLSCEGITTPGGFGSRARPQLAQGTLDAVRAVFGAEIPHYFRDLYDEGDRSVAPRVELASALDGDDPRCVVSIVGCTGDWTGGWDCVEPEGVDRFITEDLSQGRMVEVIERGEPAIMVCHWTGVYWNGEERGFKIWQEVERRLRARYADRIQWMKLCEVARYWAAKELTGIRETRTSVAFEAPFACPAFTVEVPSAPGSKAPTLAAGSEVTSLRAVSRPADLRSGTCLRERDRLVACFDLPNGRSELRG